MSRTAFWRYCCICSSSSFLTQYIVLMISFLSRFNFHIVVLPPLFELRSKLCSIRLNYPDNSHERSFNFCSFGSTLLCWETASASQEGTLLSIFFFAAQSRKRGLGFRGSEETLRKIRELLQQSALGCLKSSVSSVSYKRSFEPSRTYINQIASISRACAMRSSGNCNLLITASQPYYSHSGR